MDKLTIIRLKEAGRSNRSIERELGIGRKTVARYWKKYLNLIDSIKMNPSDSEAKDQIVEAPSYQVGNRSKRKYTPEIDARVNELIQSEIEKTQQLGPHKQKLTATGIFELSILKDLISENPLFLIKLKKSGIPIKKPLLDKNIL